jgi:hypothetical protein
VAVIPKVEEEIKSKNLFSLADFKKIMEDQKAHVVVTQLGNEKILTVDSIQDAEIQGYRIYYSPETYKITKMVIGMLRLSPLDDETDQQNIGKDTSEESNDENEIEFEGYTYYLELDYSVIKPFMPESGIFNPERKFLNIDGKKISLTAEFREYELFNSDEK